ncbi:MFS transporter [Streptomyces regalis]|uniref:Major facilitator superfamily (MFS) profile domain-containing protein n=1 Tax=Streptomyces regalis TaxID=68262 RepID=A0A0X3UXG1_9ACTN|nr:MFS transporter [Streptomyces regalis]KUL37203.1 hypothetical protein ADL12_18290 [Streptomyces regalis]
MFFDGMDVNIYGAVMPHMLVGALTAGNLTDWLGRRLTLVSSVTLFSIGSAICATAGGVGLFGCGRFIAGLGLGGLIPLCLAMAMEFAPPHRAALTTGLLMTSYHAGEQRRADWWCWVRLPGGQ